MSLSAVLAFLRKGITRNVVALAVVSLLTDVSSEMLVYLVPLYLANVLAASPSIIGLIEGTAESVAAVLKLASGAVSDRIHRRRLLVGLGYGSSSVAKALFLFATSWPIVLLARVGDRLGKGIRTAPRDALIADSTDERYRGRAFGFHRAMDTLGAFFGVFAAFLLVGMSQANAQLLDAPTFQRIVLIALVPAALAVIVIFIGVRDVRPKTAAPAKPAEPKTAPLLDNRARILRAARALPMPFWMFVAANTLFALGNSSDAFLALRTQQLGVTVRDLLLMIVAFNATNAIISFPAGILSDRFGRRVPIAIALAGLRGELRGLRPRRRPVPQPQLCGSSTAPTTGSTRPSAVRSSPTSPRPSSAGPATASSMARSRWQCCQHPSSPACCGIRSVRPRRSGSAPYCRSRRLCCWSWFDR